MKYLILKTIKPPNSFTVGGFVLSLFLIILCSVDGRSEQVGSLGYFRVFSLHCICG